MDTYVLTWSVRLQESASMLSNSARAQKYRLFRSFSEKSNLRFKAPKSQFQYDSGSYSNYDLGACGVLLSAPLVLLSRSIVTCSPSWPSVIGLSFFLPMERCRVLSLAFIHPPIFVFPSFKTFWIDMVLVESRIFLILSSSFFSFSMQNSFRRK